MTVKLSDLSNKDRAALLDELRKEVAQEAKPVSDPDEGVYTNIGEGKQYIADLGIKTGDAFSAEVFERGECKDLKDIYRLREIRSSKHLVKQSKPTPEHPFGYPLAKGRHQVDSTSRDPLAQAALARLKGGSFDDPLEGQRPYDKRLQELVDNDNKELGGLGLRGLPR